MGQIKNIKLHIVTDIKVHKTQTTVMTQTLLRRVVGWTCWKLTPPHRVLGWKPMNRIDRHPLILKVRQLLSFVYKIVTTSQPMSLLKEKSDIFVSSSCN